VRGSACAAVPRLGPGRRRGGPVGSFPRPVRGGLSSVEADPWTVFPPRSDPGRRRTHSTLPSRSSCSTRSSASTTGSRQTGRERLSTAAESAREAIDGDGRAGVSQRIRATSSKPALNQTGAAAAVRLRGLRLRFDAERRRQLRLDARLVPGQRDIHAAELRVAGNVDLRVDALAEVRVTEVAVTPAFDAVNAGVPSGRS